MATMSDVAKLAGVSIGTVSKYFSGVKTIKPANVQRIQQAIEALNYQPNKLARALKTKRSNSVALIVPDITNPFFSELLRGVEDKANQLGMTIFICNTDRHVEKERDYIVEMIGRNVDGLILVASLLGKSELFDVRKRCPVVLNDANHQLRRFFDYVNTDDTDGANQAMDYLLQTGHRRIAYVQGKMNTESGQKRFAAYLNKLADAGIARDDTLIFRGEYNTASGYEAGRQILQLPDRPDAVFAANDLMAFGIMKACREEGIRIPEDLSVIGYDDINFSSYMLPPLTTIYQPKYEVGVLSMEILHQRFSEARENQIDPAVRCRIFRPKLVIRETVRSV